MSMAGLSWSLAFSRSPVFLKIKMLFFEKKPPPSARSRLNPIPNFVRRGSASHIVKIKQMITKVIICFMVSMAGLEPARISPHAPQTCTSTIPPHRHLFCYSVVIFYQSFVADVLNFQFRTLSQKDI